MCWSESRWVCFITKKEALRLPNIVYLVKYIDNQLLCIYCIGNECSEMGQKNYLMGAFTLAPLSMVNSPPEINEASSEAKKATNLATSEGSPYRLKGILLLINS